MEIWDLEVLQVKLEYLAEMVSLEFQDFLDPQAMLGMAHMERKVSLDTLGLKVFLVVLVSLGWAMLEHLDSEERLESLVYLVYLDSRVYRDQVDKCCRAPFRVRSETLVSLGYLDGLALKVSQVSLEVQGVQGWMVEKEKGETLVLVASLDHKVSLDQEVTLELQEFQDRVLMVQVGRMVFQVFLEPRDSLERYWGPLLEILEGTVHLDSQEIRVYQGRQEPLDGLVAMAGSVFLV